MIHTIETDPESPTLDASFPPAEWTYRDWLDTMLSRGLAAFDVHLAAAGERAHRTFTTVPKFPPSASIERTVLAYVNHGRWLWDCPVCNAAQVCSPNDPRAFCVECFNGGDGYWPVEFPDTAGPIVVLLDRRPLKHQKSWHPTESVEQLQAENLRVGADPNVPGFPTYPQAALDTAAAFHAKQLTA